MQRQQIEHRSMIDESIVWCGFLCCTQPLHSRQQQKQKLSNLHDSRTRITVDPGHGNVTRHSATVGPMCVPGTETETAARTGISVMGMAYSQHMDCDERESET